MKKISVFRGDKFSSVLWLLNNDEIVVEIKYISNRLHYRWNRISFKYGKESPKLVREITRFEDAVNWGQNLEIQFISSDNIYDQAYYCWSALIRCLTKPKDLSPQERFESTVCSDCYMPFMAHAYHCACMPHPLIKINTWKCKQWLYFMSVFTLTN